MSSELKRLALDILANKNAIRDALINYGFPLAVEDQNKMSAYAAAITSLEYIPYSTTEAPQPGSFSKVQGPLTPGSPLYYNGDLVAARIFNAAYNDYAELFEADSNDWEYGDIIELNKETKKYRKSINSNSCFAVGVASDSYGHLLGGEPVSLEENLQKYIPIGLAGRVKVKVKGKVKAGDFITTSDEAGIGWAVEDIPSAFGRIIGKALEDSDGEYGLVTMLIMRA